MPIWHQDAQPAQIQVRTTMTCLFFSFCYYVMHAARINKRLPHLTSVVLAEELNDREWRDELLRCAASDTDLESYN